MTDAKDEALIKKLQQIESNLLAAAEPAMNVAAGQIGKLIHESKYPAEEVKKCLPPLLRALVGPQVEKMSDQEIALKGLEGFLSVGPRH